MVLWVVNYCRYRTPISLNMNATDANCSIHLSPRDCSLTVFPEPGASPPSIIQSLPASLLEWPIAAGFDGVEPLPVAPSSQPLLMLLLLLLLLPLFSVAPAPAINVQPAPTVVLSGLPRKLAHLCLAPLSPTGLDAQGTVAADVGEWGWFTRPAGSFWWRTAPSIAAG